MTKQEKQGEVKRKQMEANSAKDRLISIRNDLEEIGAKRKAKSLDRIIRDLEIWQNR